MENTRAIPTIKELRVICQSVKFQHFIERLYRKISIYFTWILLHTSISANQATLIQMVLGITGSLIIAFSSKSTVLIGVFFWYFGYLFDFVDGEVARYRKKSTVLGLFIDGYNHLINQSFILISVAAYAVRSSGGNIDYLYLAIPGAVFSTLPVTAAMKGAVITVIGKGVDAYKNADISSFPLLFRGKEEVVNQRKIEIFLVEKVQAVIHFPWNMVFFTILIFGQLILGNVTLPAIGLLLGLYSLAYTLVNFYFLFLWVRNGETARLYYSLKAKFKDVENVQG